MEKIFQYNYLKKFLQTYRSGKRADPMMIKVFDSILSDIESEIISEDMKRRNIK
jgi:cytochrome c553